MESSLLKIALIALVASQSIALPAVAWAYLSSRRKKLPGAKLLDGVVHPFETSIPDCSDCEAVKSLELRMDDIDSRLDGLVETQQKNEKWLAHIQRDQEAQGKEFAQVREDVGEVKGMVRTLRSALDRHL